MKIQIGDIFESHAQTLVNTVNCVGVMGKGIAKEFKQKYPGMYDEYVMLCSEKRLRPGVPYLYTNLIGEKILNFPTKDHWRSPSKLSYISSGLDWFRNHYEELGITSIAFPPLGCGNGGLTWDIVGPLMYAKLHDLPIDVTLYAPYGTQKEKLTTSFLSNNIQNISQDILGLKSRPFNKYLFLLLYSIQRVNQDQYSLFVGRVIYQKIGYILTRAGVPTGFKFQKSSYGPFSEDVKQSIVTLSNANLIKEQPRGQMMVTIVNPKFSLHKEDFSVTELEKTEFAIDLITRIKNTDHAEMITTVLFANDQVEKQYGFVSDELIMNYILSWKKRWVGTKEESIVSTILGLSSLGWIHPELSQEAILDDDDMY